jgi:hypothetical protein
MLWIAALPTPPVAHWMTRTASPSQVERVLVQWVATAGQREDITPTVSGENPGNTCAVDAPNRACTTSDSTLR